MTLAAINASSPMWGGIPMLLHAINPTSSAVATAAIMPESDELACPCRKMTRFTSKFFLAVAGQFTSRGTSGGVRCDYGSRTIDYKIYVDGGQPAMLNNGAGALTDYPSLQEAVLAWRGLPPEQKVRATIKVIRGPVYAAYQIDRLYCELKPA